jgi:hypothetical protein
MLEDAAVPLAVRVQIPRVLKRVPHQRSVEILVAAYRSGEPDIRAAALKGLSRLRETGSSLSFTNAFLTQHAINEAHRFYELAAAAAPLEAHRRERGSAASLLVRTLEDRKRDTVSRLFRLLGLISSPKEMYWSYLALSTDDKEKHANAIEYLDNVLDRDLKNVVIPIFDNPERMLERGHALFGVEPASAPSAIRAMLHSTDPWVVACAMAAAAELKLSELAAEMAQLAQRSAGDIGVVARAANAALK